MVFVIPVQPMVIILEFSIFPTVTIVGGRGAISAPPRHFIFAITSPYFTISDLFHLKLPHTPLTSLK